MAMRTAAYLQFNHGVISKYALGRLDLKRTAISSALSVNWIPRVLGPMSIRPGMEYLAPSLNSNKAHYLPFIFSTHDTALVEFTNTNLRVWINDTVLQRNDVATAITNGGFDANVTGWTDADEAGGVSDWATDGVGGGYMRLLGDGTNAAVRYQAVAIAAPDQAIEHGLQIWIHRGPVLLRIGTTIGGQELITETELKPGIHSIAFTPNAATVYIQFMSRQSYFTMVDLVLIEAGGDMTIQTHYVEADLFKLRYAQSADVIFIAADGYQQTRLERHGAHSWSLVLYQSQLGPFRLANATQITIAPSATTGTITLVASQPLFKQTSVGSIYTITSPGQHVTKAISGANVFSDPIQVTGAGESRRFSKIITGVFVGTVTLQRSVGVVGNWEDTETWTGDVNESDVDKLDNQIIYYRIGIKTAAYTSGTATVQLVYTLGFITGVARITDYTDTTHVGAEVLKTFGVTDPGDNWAEGSWSDRRGWPTAVAFYEGRLWWSGRNGIYGSVSDNFDNFDPSTVGDSGPLNRTVGSGPVDSINWLLPMQRLIIGGEGAELSLRTTAFDEPITPTNFSIKEASTQGSANVGAVKIDSRGVFLQRSTTRVYELAYDIQINDYSSNDLTALCTEFGEPGIVHIAVQRQPDTRLHCVRSDGTVLLGVLDKVENVLAWQLITTQGVIEDVTVLPGIVEDRVYYAVDRRSSGTITDIHVDTSFVYFCGDTPSFTLNGGNPTTPGQYLPVFASQSFDPTPNAGGSGYTVGDIVTMFGGDVAPGATALKFRVDAVDGSGTVTAFSRSGVEGQYTKLPAAGAVDPAGGTLGPNDTPFTFSPTTGGTGTGFQVTGVTWGLNGAFVTVVQGEGYSAAPTAVMAGGICPFIGPDTFTVSIGSLRSRNLEKLALQSECIGAGGVCKLADSFYRYQGPATTNPSTLGGGAPLLSAHLEGSDVVAWDVTTGTDLTPDDDTGVQQVYHVDPGGPFNPQIAVAVTDCIIGLPYDADWQSSKLDTLNGVGGITLASLQKLEKIGLMLVDTQHYGIRFGPDFDRLDPLPLMVDGAPVLPSHIWDQYNQQASPFPSKNAVDARLCMRARAPRPCTVVAAVFPIEDNPR